MPMTRWILCLQEVLFLLLVSPLLHRVLGVRVESECAFVLPLIKTIPTNGVQLFQVRCSSGKYYLRSPRHDWSVVPGWKCRMTATALLQPVQAADFVYAFDTGKNAVTTIRDAMKLRTLEQQGHVQRLNESAGDKKDSEEREFSGTEFTNGPDSCRGGRSTVGSTIREMTVCGWVHSVRKACRGSVLFVDLNDGSCPENLQCVVSRVIADVQVNGKRRETRRQLFSVQRGDAVCFNGVFVAVPRRRHCVELRVNLDDPCAVPWSSQCYPSATQCCSHRDDRILGATRGRTSEAPRSWVPNNVAAKRPRVDESDNSKQYKLCNDDVSMEFLRRELPHLRCRAPVLAAVMRIRSAAEAELNRSLLAKGFTRVHTPVITSLDCEGAGQVFDVSAVDPDLVRRTVDEGTGTRTDVRAADRNVDRSCDAQGVKRHCDGNLPHSSKENFFGRPVFLSVSGQLALEAMCCSMGNVYSLVPAFRAENSGTQRHLNEFWMLEVEQAFTTFESNVSLAELLIRRCITHVRHTCSGDLKVLSTWRMRSNRNGSSLPETSSGTNRRTDSSAQDEYAEMMESLAANPFRRICYGDAITVLENHARTPGCRSTAPPTWGDDLNAEDERLLLRIVCENKRGLIVLNHPEELKPFYMRLNADSRTVASADILLPLVGELAGGSEREERLSILKERMEKRNLSRKDYEFYVDLRRFGTIPHSGFGLGFDRLVMLLTGMPNIRDVIPFPRTRGYVPL